jgi:hypothetical protein
VPADQRRIDIKHVADRIFGNVLANQIYYLDSGSTPDPGGPAAFICAFPNNYAASARPTTFNAFFLKG